MNNEEQTTGTDIAGADTPVAESTDMGTSDQSSDDSVSEAPSPITETNESVMGDMLA